MLQGGGQLDVAGCVPVNDSFQVWRPVLEALALLRARVPASVPSWAPASVFVKLFQYPFPRRSK